MSSFQYIQSDILDPQFMLSWVSPDGMWAIIPCGKQWMIIHHGQQMELSRSFDIAMRKVEQMKKSQSGSRKRTKTHVTPKSQKNTKSNLTDPSGGKGSGRSSGRSDKPHTISTNPLLDALS